MYMKIFRKRNTLFSRKSVRIVFVDKRSLLRDVNSQEIWKS